MQNVHEKVRRELYENRDEAYDTFNAALIPGVSDTIGVRVPVLRALAKRLAKDGWEDYFKEADGTHEEKMIRAFLFAYVKNDDALEASARDFVPTIADWAVCDAFCQSYQTARRRTESTKEWIRRLAKSEREFEQRTACVLLLSHFLKTESAFALETIFGVDCRGYYAQMGKAWALATAAICRPQEVLAYLKICEDEKVVRLAVRKMCESYRIGEKDKVAARELRAERRI